MSVTFAQGLRNYTTLYTGLRSGIRTGRDSTGVPVRLAAHGTPQRVRSGKPVSLSESTTRGGLRLASRTPQAALRPMC